MRNSMLRASALVAGLCALPAVASAAASGSYICAIGEVYECVAVTGCNRVSTDTINLSEFIIVDVDKKQLTEAAIGENGESAVRSDRAEMLANTQPNAVDTKGPLNGV